MKEIKLSNGYVSLVDDGDYKMLKQFKWSAIVTPRTAYAYRSYWDKEKKSVRSVSMHRLIMDFPDGMQVDHINHNGLDNRKENLRVCTRSQNKQNTRKTKPNKYGYKGVALIGRGVRNKPFAAQLRHGDKCYKLGTYATPIEAARAYDEKAKELFGEFACLNFE